MLMLKENVFRGNLDTVASPKVPHSRSLLNTREVLVVSSYCGKKPHGEYEAGFGKRPIPALKISSPGDERRRPDQFAPLGRDRHDR